MIHRTKLHPKHFLFACERSVSRSLRVLLFIALSSLSISGFGQKGLIAEYYDGRDFDRKVTTRIESTIDLNWNRVPPVPGINPHVCSIRWTGELTPQESGYYTFSARVDDGIRVWIDDELIIDDWQLNDIGIFQGRMKMNGGQSYRLKVEYFNALIEGEIRLLWKFSEKKPNWFRNVMNSGDPEIIGAAYFTHDPRMARELMPQPVVTKSQKQSPPPKKSPPPPEKKVEKTYRCFCSQRTSIGNYVCPRRGNSNS